MSSPVSSSDSDGKLPSSPAFEESLNVPDKAEKWQSWEDSNTCCFGPKCQFLHVKEELRPSPNLSMNKLGRAFKQINLENKADHGNRITSNAFSSNDWSPLDDGIEVTLPSASSEKTPSKPDVNAHVERVLYGPSLRKRLPVFTKFCPK